MKRKYENLQTHTTKSPKLNQNEAYDVSKMQRVLEKELEFLSKPKINYENGFVVSSLLTPTTAKIDIEEIARLSKDDNFTAIGSTFGIDLGLDYFIPIVLDLDHRQCEKNHDCVLSASTLDSTIGAILDGLCYILKQDKLKLYVERRNCGLHVYVCNVLVSLFVYERVLDYLNSTTSFDYVFDDKLTRLPLPKQTKVDKLPYKTYIPSKKTRDVPDKWLMDKPRKLDHQYETTYETLDGRIELCRFENSHDVIQWSNIIESNVCEEKIVTSNGPIVVVKQPPQFLGRLSKRKIVSKFRLFREYCDDHRERFISCEEIKMRYALENVVSEIQVLRTLSRLGTLIGKQLHAEIYDDFDHATAAESFENIKYVFMLFRPEPEPMFEIFAACAIIEYMRLSIQRMSYEELFDQFLLVLNGFLSPCDSLVNVIGRLRGHVEAICFEVCGELSPEFILQYITLFVFYRISSKDSILNVLNVVFGIEIDDNCGFDTLATKLENLIYPFFFPCIKTHAASDEYQFYYFNLKTFVKKTFTPGKKVNGHTSNAEMPLYLVSGLLQKSKQSVVQSSFLQYISKISTVSIKMGKYAYFVNTDQGIFCNLTGTYSRHVPFLHFKDRSQTKKYCLYPDNGLFDNRSCLSYLCNAKKFSSVVERLQFCWISDVFIPGILNASALNLNHNSLQKLLMELNKRLLLQRPDSSELARLYLPVIRKFGILKSVMREALTKFRLDKLPAVFSNEAPHDIYDTYFAASSSHCDIYKEIYTHAHLILRSTVQFESRSFNVIINDNNISPEVCDFLDFFDPLLTATMRYIMQLFMYDELTALEFLKQLALLYQPKNQFRRFLLLFGATGTGKTVLMNLLSDFHGGSVCGILSKLTFNGGSENHSSLALNAATSYLTIIKEASLVDRNILKNLSGNDPIQLRSLHQEFQTIEPISFIVCVANEYPRIIGADNAIRDRLGCFNFPCSFVNELRCGNILESYIQGESLRTELHPELARGLSNLLYLTYYHFTRNNKRLHPKITNVHSIDLLNEFMIFNNPVYAYLAAAQITERADSEILEKDFKRCITRVIAHHNPGDNMTYRKFKANFDVLFPKAKLDNKIMGFHMGSSRPFHSKCMQFVVTHREEDTITEQNIINILEADESLSDIERNNDLVSFRRQYIFHRRTDAGIFVGIKQCV